MGQEVPEKEEVIEAHGKCSFQPWDCTIILIAVIEWNQSSEGRRGLGRQFYPAKLFLFIKPDPIA